jgi:hypothetical protein
MIGSHTAPKQKKVVEVWRMFSGNGSCVYCGFGELVQSAAPNTSRWVRSKQFHSIGVFAMLSLTLCGLAKGISASLPFIHIRANLISD